MGSNPTLSATRVRSAKRNYGEVLARRRGEVFLASKTGDRTYDGTMREVEESLKRLRTDWVYVLLVHWPDSGTPFDESMRALEEVVKSGRVRFVGVSNFTGAMLAECMRTRRVDVSQVGYHMFDRRQEAAHVDLGDVHGRTVPIRTAAPARFGRRPAPRGWPRPRRCARRAR